MTTHDEEELAKKTKAAKKDLTQVLSLQIPPTEAEDIAQAFGLYETPIELRDHLLQEDVNVPPSLEYGLAALANVDVEDLYIEHMIVCARYFRAKGSVDPDRASVLFHLPSMYFADVNPAVTANFTDLQIVDFLDRYEVLVENMAPSAAANLALADVLGDDFDEGVVGYADEQE